MIRALLKVLLHKQIKFMKLHKDETLVVCISEEMTQKDLGDFIKDIPEKLGDKVVFIGGVDKIIIA